MLCRDEKLAVKQVHEACVPAVASIDHVHRRLIVTVGEDILVLPVIAPHDVNSHDWQQLSGGDGLACITLWPEILEPVAAGPGPLV